MPLCYGGGIRTVAQASQLFTLGVEKVSLHTAALDDLSIVQRISDSFGTQSVVASVDIKRNWRRQPQLYRSATAKTDGRDWVEYLRSLVSAGAGEILLNAVDRDGTMKGMDIELIQEACRAVSVPLVAVGGVGSLENIKAAAAAGASGVGAGAFFVFQGPHRAVLITYPRYKDLESILAGTE
jgi:cyclase